MKNPEEYQKWVIKAVDYAIEVAKETGYTLACMQNMPSVVCSDIMIIGINPNEDWGLIDYSKFKDSDLDDIRRQNIGRYFSHNNPREWKYWKKVIKLIDNWGTPIEDIVFSNILFWGQHHKKIDYKYKCECYRMTAELVHDILRPKIVVCSSVHHVFTPLRKALGITKVENINANIKKAHPSFPNFTVQKVEYDDTIYYGVPHFTSAHWAGDRNREVLFDYIGKDMQQYLHRHATHIDEEPKI